MKDIVQTSTGAMWREVETIEEAFEIGEVAHTLVGYDFARDQERSPKNRYFVLGDDFQVVGCTPLASAEFEGKAGAANGQPFFIAHRNEDPFPTHEREIAELASAIGIQITAAHYPYRRPDIAPSQDEGPNGMSPG